MKILVVKLNALGDLVIATPAIKRLREGLPFATIHLLTTDWSAPAVMNNPNLNQIIVVPNRIFFQPSIKTVFPTYRLFKKLYNYKYEAAVIFHKNKNVVKFITFLGIEKLYYFIDLYDIKGEGVVLDEARHSAITAWELADLVVRKLNGQSSEVPYLQDLEYQWFCSDDEVNEARSIIQHWGLKEREFIVFFPGGGKNPNINEPVRRWGTYKWANLANLIIEKYHYKVVLLGNQDDKEVCALTNLQCGGKLFNLSGRYNIRQTAAIVKMSKLVISNDSAPLHISGALGVPTVGIYGPNGAQHKLPPGKYCYSISAGLKCSPCFFTVFKGCIYDYIKCMEDLTPEFVFDRVKYILDNAFNNL